MPRAAVTVGRAVIDFRTLPDLGIVFAVDGQEYELVKFEDYTRVDGVATNLLVWHSHCPDCGSQFEIKTGLATRAVNRRCSNCKRTGKPVKGRRGRKCQVTVTIA